MATQFVNIDGVRLEYERYGPSSSETPTIVFLHEGLGSITRWRDFPAALCAKLGWSGLVYNRQGYGSSDPLHGPLTPHFMHSEALEVLPRLLDTFDISRPILFGHSDGGSIALICAGSGAVTPAALILEASHVFVEELTVTSIAKVRDSYRSTDLRARLERHHGSNVDSLFEFWTDVWLSEEFRSWNITEFLPAITCSTLVIQGSDDEYGTGRQMEAIARSVSGHAETLVLERCGHSPHIDQPQTVEAVAVRFLRSTQMHTGA